ncbi:hypothetical protein ACFQVA_16555 [Actinomadura keratinilytica]
MNIIDLAPGDPRLTTDALPVLAELRPHLTARLLEEVHAAYHPQGLRFSALYDTEGRCVAVAGWRVIANTSAIRKLYVDDLVTAEAACSTGAAGNSSRTWRTGPASWTAASWISTRAPSAPTPTASTCASGSRSARSTSPSCCAEGRLGRGPGGRGAYAGGWFRGSSGLGSRPADLLRGAPS